LYRCENVIIRPFSHRREAALLSIIDAFPPAIIPAALLLVVWIALRFTGRRTGWWFFLGGAAFAALCIPIGFFLGELEPPCDSPDHSIWACGMDVPLVLGVFGAMLAGICLAGLLVLTAFLQLFVPRSGEK
jgi:hypothetical protein